MVPTPKYYEKSAYPASLVALGLLVIDHHGGDYEKVSELTGFPVATLRQWGENRNNPAAEEFYEQMQGDNSYLFKLKGKLYGIVEKSIEAIDEKLANPEKLHLSQINETLKIAIDKFMVLEGQPTNITGSVTVSGELREFQEIKAARAVEVLREARQRRLQGGNVSGLDISPEFIEALDTISELEGNNGDTETEADTNINDTTEGGNT